MKQPIENRLRESAMTLSKYATHEIPAMAGFCARLRDELREAAEEIEHMRALTTETG